MADINDIARIQYVMDSYDTMTAAGVLPLTWKQKKATHEEVRWHLPWFIKSRQTDRTM